MSRSDRVLADAEAVLRRHSERGRSLSARARDRRNASIMRRLGRIGGAIFVILMGAMIAGWFLPLGTNGVMIVLGLLLIATMFFALLPGDRPVSADTLAQTELPALPLKTEIWLETQRKALPAPAVTLIDSIGVRLETLAPQLERLNEQDPAALEIRRLLSDHLPELVEAVLKDHCFDRQRHDVELSSDPVNCGPLLPFLEGEPNPERRP